MNDLQTKFAMSVVVFGLFLAYALPAFKQAKYDHDTVGRLVGTVYVAPNPNDPNAPHGHITEDEILKYRDQKAAERRSQGLQ